MLKNLFTSLKLNNFKKMLLRFPVAFVIVLAFSVVMFIAVNHDFIQGKLLDNLLKSALTFSLMFFLSLGIYLTSEETKLDRKKSTLMQFIPLVFGVLFYYFFNADFYYYSNVIFYFLCLVGIGGFLFFAPFLGMLSIKKEVKNELFFQYFYKILVVFLFGFVLGGLLFALGALAIWAVEALFDLEWHWINDFFSNWAVIALALITPTVCLMEIPEDNIKLDKKFVINSFFRFIIKYVFTSFIVVYFLILYAYSIKVLSNFSDWPRQEVTTLVVVFSVFSYLGYILLHHYENDSKTIGIIRKSVPYIVIPQLFMLFYAIYLRIAQYDITINRYFVVVFGLWLLIISLYYIFSKRKSLIAVPMILTIFVVLIGTGPWSVFSLPESRQISRLESNLIKANILQDGKIVPLNDYTDIDKELSKQIYDGIQYVCYNFTCEKIALMFDKPMSLDRWEIIRQVTDEIKVKTYYSYDYGNQAEEKEPSIIYVNMQDEIYPLDIKGYDKILDLTSLDTYDKYYGDLEINAKITEESTSHLSIILDLEQNNVYINNGKERLDVIESININDIIYNKIKEKYGENYNDKYNSNLSKEDLTFDLQGTKYAVKLIITNINIKTPNFDINKENYYNNYAGGIVLIKEL